MDHTVYMLALGGGLFALLTLVHFVVDWLFQSHAEAMVKHNHPWIRAKHCVIYTVGFIPLLYILHFTLLEMFIGINILFWSHFVEDMYLPLYWWAKYMRKPPEMIDPWKESFTDINGEITIKVHPPDSQRGFVQFIQTPLGKILMITVDQIIHLLFLLPLVWMALN